MHRTETDWDKVRKWLEEQEEKEKEPAEWEFVGDPYEQLRQFNKTCTRTVKICGRSKRWWKREWKEKRKAALKDKNVRKEWHREIKKANAEVSKNG